MVIRMNPEFRPQEEDIATGKNLIAVGQICSNSSMEHNLKQCRHVINKAVRAGATAVFLPEASDYISTSSEEALSLCVPADKSPFILGLREDAKKHSIFISVGVHEPSDDPESKRIKNTLIWIDKHGNLTQRYQKLHLFDLELEDGPIFKESNFVEPGKEIQPPFKTPLGKMGSLICFDLRFPEPALALKRQQADIILYPSAFTVPTGEAHWHSLLRARAIETQTYVIAAAQAGEHHKGRTSYGHSIIVDPWGKILTELGGEFKDEPEVIFAEIDLDQVKSVKRQMPLLRRTDVYPEI